MLFLFQLYMEDVSSNWNESFSLGEFVTFREVCFSFNVKKILESKFIFSGDDIGWFALVYL